MVVVVDCVRGEAQARLLCRDAALRRPGLGRFGPRQTLASRHSMRAALFLVAMNAADLTRITAPFESEHLTHNVGINRPLTAARAAHETLEGAAAAARQDHTRSGRANAFQFGPVHVRFAEGHCCTSMAGLGAKPPWDQEWPRSITDLLRPLSICRSKARFRSRTVACVGEQRPRHNKIRE